MNDGSVDNSLFYDKQNERGAGVKKSTSQTNDKQNDLDVKQRQNDLGSQQSYNDSSVSLNDIDLGLSDNSLSEKNKGEDTETKENQQDINQNKDNKSIDKKGSGGIFNSVSNFINNAIGNSPSPLSLSQNTASNNRSDQKTSLDKNRENAGKGSGGKLGQLFSGIPKFLSRGVDDLRARVAPSKPSHKPLGPASSPTNNNNKAKQNQQKAIQENRKIEQQNVENDKRRQEEDKLRKMAEKRRAEEKEKEYQDQLKKIDDDLAKKLTANKNEYSNKINKTSESTKKENDELEQKIAEFGRIFDEYKHDPEKRQEKISEFLDENFSPEIKHNVQKILETDMGIKKNNTEVQPKSNNQERNKPEKQNTQSSGIENNGLFEKEQLEEQKQSVAKSAGISKASELSAQNRPNNKQKTQSSGIEDNGLFGEKQLEDKQKGGYDEIKQEQSITNGAKISKTSGISTQNKFTHNVERGERGERSI